MSIKEDLEEHFMLRVEDQNLREKLAKWLKEEIDVSGHLELSFTEPGRNGRLSVDGVSYPVTVLDLPTVVESYKTYDDINLVKTADVGQILLVQAPDSSPPDSTESKHGVTPPMRNARGRAFRPHINAHPNVVHEVEQAVVTILQGRAPEGIKFIDVEEEYVVDPVSGEGSWQPVPRR